MDVSRVIPFYLKGLTSIKKLGGGLVNQTYLVENHDKKLVIQRINERIFPKPLHLIENYKAIYAYLQQTSAAELCIPLIPTLQGAWHLEQQGYWRAFSYIQSPTFETVKCADQAFEAAHAFARFQYALKDFPTDKLNVPLPGFTDFAARWNHFQKAIRINLMDTREFNHILEALSTRSDYIKQAIRVQQKSPIRIVHNDAKISNLLFGIPPKILDWDTLYYGSLFQDMGDMIRTFVPSADENETGLKSLVLRPEILKAIRLGLADVWKDAWTSREKNAFVFSGKLYFYIQALRFMTDFLLGNPYYQIEYPNQNLDRCKNQLHCLKQLESLSNSVDYD